MLAKRIIPCLDIKDGRVVKGTKFLHLKDAGDPVGNASFYDREGADELVFLDISASFEKRPILLEVVKKVAEAIFIPFTVGGGIRDIDDIRMLLNSGCDKVSINTTAVKNPSLVDKSSKRFGSQCIVVAIDAKQIGQKDTWEVFINGGKTATGIDALRWAKEVAKRGAGEILLTSMDRDGTKNGYDIKLTKRIADSVDIPVIASGGAGNLMHLYEAFCSGADAALAASIFHYRQYSIKKVKLYLKKKGIHVRL
ncbi:MAG: imidazole glycerol phosphate synthase subunit HisF [Candidatus Omnitrophota bacterium]